MGFAFERVGIHDVRESWKLTSWTASRMQRKREPWETQGLPPQCRTWSNVSTNWRPSIETYEPMVYILM